MNDQIYTKDLQSHIYNLGRNYYVSGFLSEAERIAEGLLAVNQSMIPARLLLGTVHFEKGNFSLAANHFRIAAQEKGYSTAAKLGILASYCGLRDYARAASLASELQTEISSASESFRIFYDLYNQTVEKAVSS